MSFYEYLGGVGYKKHKSFMILPKLHLQIKNYNYYTRFMKTENKECYECWNGNKMLVEYSEESFITLYWVGFPSIFHALHYIRSYYIYFHLKFYWFSSIIIFSFLPSTRVVKKTATEFVVMEFLPFFPHLVWVRRRPEGRRRRKKNLVKFKIFFRIFHLCGSQKTSDGKVKHKRKSRL